MSEKRSFIVHVEGNIGAGKSTFIEHFSQFPEVETFYEPVERWRSIDVNGKKINLLNLFYENPERYAYLFQSYIRQTRIEQELRPCLKPTKIFERSRESSKLCFAKNLNIMKQMSDLEYKIYCDEDDTLKNCCVPDLIIYLRVPPYICRKRISARNRKEENEISLSYLEDLHTLHDDWLLPLGNHVIVIDDDGASKMKNIYKTLEERIIHKEFVLKTNVNK